jgi:O-antigen/teichoic acid export membrane protein
MTNQGLKFVLNLGSTAILARLLTPEDFGLIGMVIAIVTFTTMFKDLGLSAATLQRSDINHGQVSTLFWITVGLSVVIAAIMAAIAPLIGWLYKEPRVVKLTVVLAMAIILGGPAQQPLALLRRQMRFGAAAMVELTAVALGLAAAVIGALAGMGYWSLALVVLTREACMSIGTWRMCGWRPGRPVRRSGVRTMLSFGAHLAGFNILNYLARNVDKVLIGRVFGAAPLGLYNKAYQLVLLPIQQINMPLTAVAVPTLSRLQNEHERYRAYYRRGVLLTVSAGMPIVAFLFVAADKAVLTLLGSQWADAVEIFRVLGPAAFIGTFNVATGWVYVSLGRTKRQFHWGIFGASMTMIAYAIGLRWGPLGVAAAFSAVLIVLRLPAIIYCFRGTHLRLVDLGVALWRPAASSLAAGALLYLAGKFTEFTLPVGLSLTLDFLLYMLFYILIWVALPRGRQSFRDVLQIVRDIRKTPGGATATRHEETGDGSENV